MEFALWALFILLIAIALLGCFIHRFPGPILAFAAILMAKFCMKAGALISWGAIVIIAILVAACFFINKQLPKITQKLGTYGKAANWGTLLGSVVAIIFMAILPIANPYVALIVLLLFMIIFPFGFATLFEYNAQKDWNKAMISARSATVTYVCSTVLKLVTVIYSIYLMFTV